MRRFFRSPSPALVVACVALLAALAGTSFASQSAPKSPIVVSKPGVIGANSPGSLLVQCPKGRFATGGGFFLDGRQSHDDHAIDSEPAKPGTPAQNGFVPQGAGNPTGWHVTIYNPNADARTGTVYVLCV